MAAIISGGDGPTSLPRITPVKPGAVKALGKALGSPRQKAVRNAVGGYQATGSPSIVSGSDQTVRSRGSAGGYQPARGMPARGYQPLTLPSSSPIGQLRAPKPKLPKGSSIISGGG